MKKEPVRVDVTANRPSCLSKPLAIASSAPTTTASTSSNSAKGKNKPVCRFYNTKNGRSYSYPLLGFHVIFILFPLFIIVYQPKILRLCDVDYFQAVELEKTANFAIHQHPRTKSSPAKVLKRPHQLPWHQKHLLGMCKPALNRELWLGLFPKLRLKIQGSSRSVRSNGDTSQQYPSTTDQRTCPSA